MTQLRDVLIGSPQRPGYLQDMQGVSVSGNATGIPDKLEDLYKLPTGAAVFDIDTRLGWHGPYLTNLTGKYDATKPSFSRGLR